MNSDSGKSSETFLKAAQLLLDAGFRVTYPTSPGTKYLPESTVAVTPEEVVLIATKGEIVWQAHCHGVSVERFERCSRTSDGAFLQTTIPDDLLDVYWTAFSEGEHGTLRIKCDVITKKGRPCQGNVLHGFKGFVKNGFVSLCMIHNAHKGTEHWGDELTLLSQKRKSVAGIKAKTNAEAQV